MASIFTYTDYQAYLADVMKSKPRYSLRKWGTELGMDASYLSKVIHKKIHLGNSQARIICKSLSLGTTERNYFHLILRFAKAKRSDEAERIMEEAQRLKPVHIRSLAEDQYDFLSHWYIPAIRDILGMGYRFSSFKDLAQTLEPTISVAECKKAIYCLENLGLAKGSFATGYSLTDTHIASGNHVRTVAVRAYQKELARLQARAIDEIPKEMRDISSLSISVDAQAFQDIQRIIKDTRLSIQKRLEQVQQPTRVYQCNFSLFPVSKECLQ